nr:amidohydrolase family protein [Qipengyuania marisflavi]
MANGMTPALAIRAATLDAAKVIGREGELGSITPGKFADLVAERGKPMADIHVMEHIARFIKRGEVFR